MPQRSNPPTEATGQSLNNHFTAIPREVDAPSEENAEFLEPASEESARELGYTDENGKAVAIARADKKGHPTDAYTDIGEGRSSVVKPSDTLDKPLRLLANGLIHPWKIAAAKT